MTHTLQFTLKTTAIIAVIFAVHTTLLHLLSQPIWNNHIIAAYTVNLVLVVTIYNTLFLLKHIHKSHLGFLFMLGSTLKFAVFFTVFYPIYKHHHNITTNAFLAFFVPYSVGLILETTSLIKHLNTCHKTP